MGESVDPEAPAVVGLGVTKAGMIGISRAAGIETVTTVGVVSGTIGIKVPWVMISVTGKQYDGYEVTVTVTVTVFSATSKSISKANLDREHIIIADLHGQLIGIPLQPFDYAFVGL